MSLVLASSNSQYWQRKMDLTKAAFGGVTGVETGYTLMAWIRFTANPATGTWINPVSLGSPTTNGFSAIGVDEGFAGFASEYSDGATNGQYAASGGTPSWTLGNWTCFVVLFTANGKQNFYDSLHGSTLFTNANGQLDPCTYDGLYVGWQSSYSFAGPGGNVSTANCQVAEVAVWKNTLGVGEALALMEGENPLSIRRGDLYSYHPLRTNLNDYGPQGLAMIPIGGAVTTFADHPNVAPIPRPKFQQLKAATAGATISPSSYVYMTYPW